MSERTETKGTEYLSESQAVDHVEKLFQWADQIIPHELPKELKEKMESRLYELLFPEGLEGDYGNPTRVEVTDALLPLIDPHITPYTENPDYTVRIGRFEYRENEQSKVRWELDITRNQPGEPVEPPDIEIPEQPEVKPIDLSPIREPLEQVDESLGELTEATNNISTSIDRQTTNISRDITNLGDSITNQIDVSLDETNSVLESIVDAITGISETFVDIVSDPIDRMGDFLGDIVDGIGNLPGQLIEGFTSGLEYVIDGISSTITGLYTNIANGFQALLSGLYEAIKELTTTLYSLLDDLFKFITSALDYTTEDLITWICEIMQLFIQLRQQCGILQEEG